jgi:hypothetical protein
VHFLPVGGNLLAAVDSITPRGSVSQILRGDRATQVAGDGLGATEERLRKSPPIATSFGASRGARKSWIRWVCRMTIGGKRMSVRALIMTVLLAAALPAFGVDARDAQ